MGAGGHFIPALLLQNLAGVEPAPLGCPVWRGEGWDGTGRDGRSDPWHLLDAELAHGVIHQDGHVLHGHSDVPVCPAALIWPVLSTFTLWGEKTGAGELWIASQGWEWLQFMPIGIGCARFGPVWVKSQSVKPLGTYLFPLLQVGHHDNCRCVLLPNHPPKIVHCLFLWS